MKRWMSSLGSRGGAEGWGLGGLGWELGVGGWGLQGNYGGVGDGQLKGFMVKCEGA